MRNPEHWTPSKYVWRRGRLAASHDAAVLGVGSRLVAERVAACYGGYLPRRELIRFMDALEYHDLVVVDESFIDKV